MRRSLLRPVAMISILLLTILAAVYYFVQHPEVDQQLRQTSPAILGLLLVLYLSGVVALSLVNLATLRLCRAKLSSGDSLLLTAYSAIINFFGPLQSGPAFRAVYLKKRLDLNLKKYAAASLVYYFFYGSFSAVLLLSGLVRWWLLPPGLMGLLLLFAIRRHPLIANKLNGLDLRGWYYLAAAAALQIIIVTAIYYVELQTVAPGTHLSQAIVYSGAANLALFVSLTPGAIGFRESFLVFSQHLHHVSNSSIVAANILDRAVYIILLLLLAAFIFGTHASRHLRVDSAD